MSFHICKCSNNGTELLSSWNMNNKNILLYLKNFTHIAQDANKLLILFLLIFIHFYL